MRFLVSFVKKDGIRPSISCQIILELEIRDSQNLAKLGLCGQLIRSDVVFCLCSVVS